LPTERIPIAIVGLNWGLQMIRQLRSPRASHLFEVVGVCAAHPDKAERIAAEIGARAYPSLDAIVDDPAVPAVGLFVGPDLRAEMVLALIRAGKHVITTKPLDLDPDRGLEVLREARRLGRAVHLNSPGPVLTPDLVQIQRWREACDLGRPIGCRGDLWVSYHEQADGSWYDDPLRAPGAPIFRLGIYLLNDIVQLFGVPDLVYLLQTRIRTGRPTADNAQLALRFPDGALGNVFVSFCVDDGEPYRSALTLNYERGTIYRNVGPSERPPTRDLVRLELSACPPDRDRVFERAEVSGGSGTYNWEAFHRAVRGERLEGALPPEDIVAGLRVVTALARSERSGLPEPVR
jgi:predicted dehydrogenase